jgi:hypothetical protein
MKIFMPVTATVEPELVGLAVNVMAVPLVLAVLNADALGAVFKRSTDSLLMTTLLSPTVLGVEAVLGV